MLLLMAMLLIACQSSDEDNGSPDDCYLDIYVYAPGRPIVTRGDVGEVSPSDAEKKVKTLQIWVFKSGSGALVGHLSVTNPTYLNGSAGQEKYRMLVDKAFANAPEDVDVYVVANEASCGLTFNKDTKRTTLDAAQIGTDYFGTTNCYGQGDLILPTGRIATNGLPMSAVAKNQPITGSFPALRIGSQDQMTILQLTRAVSKLRFVLCQIKNNDSGRNLVSIDAISMSENQIPDKTWLIARETNGFTYSQDDPISYISSPILQKDIPSVADPMIYQYETQKAQDYEDLINHASDEVSSRKEANLAWLKQYGGDNQLFSSLTVDDLPQLKQIGLTYLRESDLQLTGTITYTYSEGGNNHSESIDFSMAAPGDFLRNHSWIVYIFYMGAKIHVHVVTDIGMKKWTPDNEQDDVIVYNW